jgi:hypothetical protein
VNARLANGLTLQGGATTGHGIRDTCDVQAKLTLARHVGARLSGLHLTPTPDVPLKFKPSHIIREASEISRNLASDARVARSSSRKRPNNA